MKNLKKEEKAVEKHTENTDYKKNTLSNILKTLKMINCLYHLAEKIDVNKTYISKLTYYKKREVFVTKSLVRASPN